MYCVVIYSELSDIERRIPSFYPNVNYILSLSTRPANRDVLATYFLISAVGQLSFVAIRNLDTRLSSGSMLTTVYVSYNSHLAD